MVSSTPVEKSSSVAPGKIHSSTRTPKNCLSTHGADRKSHKLTNDLEKSLVKSFKTLCPKGIHEIGSTEKACICMKAERMARLQEGFVLYEWHTSEPEILNGKVITETGSTPALDDFLLMYPMKMSTGGQGTVAWVHLQSNSMQYAHKFKAREGRSEKNWVIELREAKILRNLKHSFILKYVICVILLDLVKIKVHVFRLIA